MVCRGHADSKRVEPHSDQKGWSSSSSLFPVSLQGLSHSLRIKSTLRSLVGALPKWTSLPPLLTHMCWFPLLSMPLTSLLLFLTNSCSSFASWHRCPLLARPTLAPRWRTATLSPVAVMLPRTVVICLGPSPPTGPSSSMRDCISSAWLPGGGKPLNTPRYLSDSGQSRPANKCPHVGTPGPLEHEGL